jgi:hypothetical protein
MFSFDRAFTGDPVAVIAPAKADVGKVLVHVRARTKRHMAHSPTFLSFRVAPRAAGEQAS